MPKADLSLGLVVHTGWDKMKQHFWLFLQVLIVTFILYVISQHLKDVTYKISVWLGDFISVLIWLIATAVSMSIAQLSLRVFDDIPVKLKNLLDIKLSCFGNYIISSLVLAVVPMVLGTLFSYILIPIVLPVIIGAITMPVMAVIIVGLIVVVAVWLAAWYYLSFQFAGLIILDKDLPVIKALAYSFKITKGYKFNLLFLIILLGLINLLGAMAALVGLIATIPLSWIAMVYVYRFLVKNKEEAMITSVIDQPVSNSPISN